MADAVLKMTLIGEDKSASKALRNVGDEAQKTKSRLDHIKGTALGTAMGAGMAALPGLIANATGSVIDFGGQSIEAFRGAQAEQKKLEEAHGRFPGMADRSIESYRALNQAIQDKVGADADDLAGAQAVLGQYELTGGQIQQLTPLLVDYATKTGKSLPEAAEALGKATLGQGRALKEVGIDFKNTGDKGKNFDQIVGGLTDKVAGFAENGVDPAARKSAIMQAKMGDLQESIGQGLMPAVEAATDAGIAMLDWLEENPEVVQGVIGVLETMAQIVTWLGRDVIVPLVLPPLGMLADALIWIMRQAAGMLRALGSVPGFEWATEAADKLDGAADSAERLKKRLEDLDKKSVKIQVGIHTIYTNQGRAPSGEVAYKTGSGSFFERDGGVVRYYAGGGVENHVAQIAPAGSWRVWAEPETGGEAYIPLAPSKRQRSLQIWQETGRRLGVAANSDGSLTGGGAALLAGATVIIEVPGLAGAFRGEVKAVLSESAGRAKR